MIELAPQFILDRYRCGELRGRFTGAALFVDLVGFTSMTESLMVHGVAGAEQVSAVINTVFDPAVRITYRRGGWVAKYAGDAFLALFPRTGSRPDLAAREIADGLSGGHQVMTPYGSFPISARVGASGGGVSWGIIPGARHNLFFFAGSAVRGAIEAQDGAQPGSSVTRLLKSWPPSEAAGLSALLTDDASDRAERLIRPVRPSRLPGLASFVPKEIRDLGTTGEFREIACAFLGYRGRSEPVDWRDPTRLTRVIAAVRAEVRRFGGYLSELDFGDKGNVVVIYFGAPRGLERPAMHALGFATSVREALADSVSMRVGLAVGRVYAGLVGSALRSEYKAVGRTVNVAARLMAASPWEDILLDAASARGTEEEFTLEPRGGMDLKGIQGTVEVMAVTGARRAPRRRAKGSMVGRAHDVALVCEHLAGSEGERRARVVYVDGPAGVGKSRLVQEARNACAGRCAWFSLSCDGILRESLNPIVRWVAEYFVIGVDTSLDERRRLFDDTMDLLLRSSQAETRQELVRTRSVLGALLGLRWENSFYEQLDAKGRFANLAVALMRLFMAESSRRQVVIELEDCHWIDTESAELLCRVMRGLREHPVLLLATCRPASDGSVFRLPLPELRAASISLDALDRNGSAQLAEARLGMRPSVPLTEFIWAKSEGNPFYVEQLLLLLQAGGAIRHVRGIATLACEPPGLPGTLSALIVARADRLPPRVRQIAKVAAVLGREFASPVLAAMLPSSPTAPLLAAGQRHGLWSRRSEGHYSFLHALIRDALYEMQLTTERSHLHLRAGQAIEALHEGDLDPHCGALAHHFDLGGDAVKARHYLARAAESAEALFSNDDALRLLERLSHYATSPAEAADVSLRRGRVLERVGRLDEAASLLEEGTAAAMAAGDVSLLFRLRNAWGDVLLQQGRNEEARNLFTLNLRYCQDHGDDAGCSIALSNLGRLHRAEGDLEGAVARYRKAIRLAARAGDSRRVAYALGNLGNIHYHRGDRARAERCYSRCLAKSMELGDLYSVCRCHSSLGLVQFQWGQYDVAARHFREQLAMARRIGDQSMMAMALENVGLLYERAGEWEKAAESFVRRAQLEEEIGSQRSVATSLAMAARAHFAAGHHERGIILSDRAIALARKLGMKDFLIHFLTDRASALVRRAETEASALEDDIEGLCNEAVELAQQVGMRNAVFLPMLARARLDALRGMREAAMEMLESLAAEWTDGNDQALIREAMARISRDPAMIRDAFSRFGEMYREDPDCTYLAAMRRLAALDEAKELDLLDDVKPATWTAVLDTVSPC